MISKQEETNLLIKAQAQTPVTKIPREHSVSSIKKTNTKVKTKLKKAGAPRNK